MRSHAFSTTSRLHRQAHGVRRWSCAPRQTRSPFCPRRWRGALLPNDAKVRIEVLEPDKRPVSAVADHTEFRDVVEVEVMEESGIDILMLFDPGHSLAERVLAEQFGY